mmetsp:Transcript_54695/g.123059  ORF Transcript_54695/g.123059 Transcript_54695/m.123059 type:complete len:227 (+) Transcript_54695:74-754(+)
MSSCPLEPRCRRRPSPVLPSTPLVEEVGGGLGIVAASFHDLHPVAIRIPSEGQALHGAGVGRLLHGVAGHLQLLALRVDVVNKETSVSEPLTAVLVAAEVGKVGIVLGAMVVGELKHGTSRRQTRLALWHRSQEVERKAVIVALRKQRHAEVLCVKIKRLLGVLDPEHGLGQCVATDGPVAPHELDPVAVGVQRKGQALHAALVWLFLEGNALPFKLFAALIDVGD